VGYLGCCGLTLVAPMYIFYILRGAFCFLFNITLLIYQKKKKVLSRIRKSIVRSKLRAHSWLYLVIGVKIQRSQDSCDRSEEQEEVSAAHLSFM
jgi:hypothetical protein